MEIKADRQKFAEAFSIVSQVVPSRSPTVDITNVLLVASKDSVVLHATDNEVSARMEVEGVEVTKEGSRLLPAGRFGGMLREIEDEKISISGIENGVMFSSSSVHGKLESPDPMQFPIVVEFKEDRFYSLPSRALSAILEMTKFCCDEKSTRYCLGGVMTEVSGKSISVTATDGRRLATMCIEVDQDVKDESDHLQFGGVIPLKAASLIAKALAGSPESKADLSIDTNKVSVRSGPFTIHARLVEGRFPKWQTVFPPGDPSYKVDLQVGQLRSAVRQSSVTTDVHSRGVDFSVEGDGKVSLCGAARQVGSSKASFPVAYEGDRFESRVDFRFLLQFANALDSEKTITLESDGDDKPLVFKSDDGYRYVIMPMTP